VSETRVAVGEAEILPLTSRSSRPARGDGWRQDKVK